MSGGSKVFTVAMWAGPGRADGARETSGSSSRTHASTSGSSGMRIVCTVMAGPIQVEVTRGGVVEAVHTVHAVAVRDGRIVASSGRPAARHLPALVGEAAPGASARPHATRSRRPRDRDRVRLAPRPCPSSSTPCARSSPRRRRTRRSSRPGRRRADRAQLLGQARRVPRSLQGRGLETRATASRRTLSSGSCWRRSPPRRTSTRRRSPSRSTAAACRPSRFRSSAARTRSASCRVLDGGARVIAAMRAHPELLRGPVAADASSFGSSMAGSRKGGAEGLFCACSDDGLAVALKVEDGSFRAIRPALAAFLSRSASRRATSASSRWKTATANCRGGRSVRPESRVPRWPI